MNVIINSHKHHTVHSVPCLQDNYIHILHDGGNRAAVVDPGEAAPALRLLAERGWTLDAVYITHRHADHIGDLPELLQTHPAPAPVYAPAGCDIADARHVQGGDHLPLFDDPAALRVISTPGHTLEHVAFAGDGFALTGDTLFVAGCGRVFEGSMAQMHESLMRLAALPDDTRFYCGHDYTRANLRFAAAVEPDNAAIGERLRAAEDMQAAGQGVASGTLAQERQTNPFLRTGVAAVAQAARRQCGDKLESEAEIFGALRRWKDNF